MTSLACNCSPPRPIHPKSHHQTLVAEKDYLQKQFSISAFVRNSCTYREGVSEVHSNCPAKKLDSRLVLLTRICIKMCQKLEVGNEKWGRLTFQIFGSVTPQIQVSKLLFSVPPLDSISVEQLHLIGKTGV